VNEKTFESIAEDLGVTPRWLSTILQNHNAIIVPAKKQYPFLQVNRETILSTPTRDLIKFGLSTRTYYRLMEVLDPKRPGACKTDFPQTLGAYKGNFVISELRMISGVGTGTLRELLTLFDHIGLKYIDDVVTDHLHGK
jgi:hypothetical protein